MDDVLQPIDEALHVSEFRAWMRWTQVEAANWYGVTERSWRRYENGERRVPKPLLRRINESLAKHRRKR